MHCNNCICRLKVQLPGYMNGTQSEQPAADSATLAAPTSSDFDVPVWLFYSLPCFCRPSLNASITSAMLAGRALWPCTGRVRSFGASGRKHAPTHELRGNRLQHTAWLAQQRRRCWVTDRVQLATSRDVGTSRRTATSIIIIGVTQCKMQPRAQLHMVAELSSR